MIQLLVQGAKYIMMLLFLIYTIACFVKKHIFVCYFQRSLMYLIHFVAFVVLYLTTKNTQLIAFYFLQVILISAILIVYRVFYKRANALLLNNMCMLLVIGLIMLTRLSMDKAMRQYGFLLAGAILAVLIPVIMEHMSVFRRLTWIYAVLGIGALLWVAVAGNVEFGARLSITIGGFSVQPSEFVKIVYVFFIASILRDQHDLKRVVLTGVICALFVLALVASKDLGGALLYFMTFLIMVYVASHHLIYFVGGMGCLALGSVLAARFFSHVRTRVLAWKDPLSVIDNQGYQVSQSLFGIGTGGWFGLGLNQGLPKKIPVVENDFIFAAISEEMGGVFAVCVIMVCISCFILFMNIAMQMKDPFYKLVALGLGSLYIMQVFLTIGGVIKFIPSTGVTLPLVSYGGSSLLSTLILFGVIQGLYMKQSLERNVPDAKAEVDDEEETKIS